MNATQKIRLLIFIPTLECGGMEKYIRLLCDHIDTTAFDVTLAVLNNAHPFFVIENKAINVIDLKVLHVRYAAFKILRTIKKNKPGIVFSTGNHLNLCMAILRRFISKNIIVVARESSIVGLNNRRAKFPSLYDRLVKKFYSRLDFVISQSKYMESDLINNYHIRPGRSTVIYNPVEVQATGHTPVPNKFITVARLSEEKGISRLIASVALLQEPFVYYIMGEGDQHAVLQKQINELQLQDSIFLTGRKKDPFAGMEDAALFLMGSHYEGLGNVLLEAGARGIPVVAFDAPGGVGEVVREGENGSLVKDNDINSFAHAIEKALKTNFDRQQIIADTKKRYSVNIIIPLMEDLFKQLRKGRNV